MLNDKIILKSQQRFKSDHDRVYKEEVNKIVLTSNDNKRIQTFDKAFKICESEFIYLLKKIFQLKR